MIRYIFPTRKSPLNNAGEEAFLSHRFTSRDYLIARDRKQNWPGTRIRGEGSESPSAVDVGDADEVHFPTGTSTRSGLKHRHADAKLPVLSSPEFERGSGSTWASSRASNAQSLANVRGMEGRTSQGRYQTPLLSRRPTWPTKDFHGPSDPGIRWPPARKGRRAEDRTLPSAEAAARPGLGPSIWDHMQSTGHRTPALAHM